MLNEFGRSPFIFPERGLGEVTNALCRKVILAGGDVKMNTRIQSFAYKEDGSSKEGEIKGIIT